MASSKNFYTWQSWDEVAKKLSGSAGLLIGNGFSIGCNSGFDYRNLLEVAAGNGLPPRIIAAFEHGDTANFEAVMRMFDDSKYMAELYGCQCDVPALLEDDIEKTRHALIKAVADVHGDLADARALPREQKDCCAHFLARFQVVYTLCYDFLLYWVMMYAVDQGIIGNQKDGFWGDEMDGARSYRFLKHHTGFRFLHGALHLFADNGVTGKHIYREGESLLDQVRHGLSRGRYPLFIAEGTPEQKLVGIQRQPYLNDSWEDFERLGPDLVLYGCALSESDAHIVKAIIRNKDLQRLYVSVYGSPGEKSYESVLSALNYVQRERGAGKRLKEVGAFPAAEARVWAA